MSRTYWMGSGPSPQAAVSLPRFGRRRRSHGMVVLVVLVVALMLLDGLPARGFARSNPVPGNPPALPVKASAPARFSVASTSRTPSAGAGYESLCLLGILRDCRSAPSPAPQRPVPLAGSSSSWTNITPPGGKPNPAARILPSMTYFPSGHETILFGGFLAGPPFFAQDTWAFTHNSWTELIANSTCTAASCPSPRGDAMLAYYAPWNGLLLFGGAISLLGFTTAYNDTWLFSGGVWSNVTATVGSAPSPRFGAAMTWDSFDNDILLFGGALSNGVTVGDTWTFNGSWHNITSSFPSVHPGPRAGTAITGSPSGYIMMFGGEMWNGSASVVLVDDTGACVLPDVGWWFHAGLWSHMNYGGPCPNLPSTPGVPHPGYAAPCGRVDASLGWSPKNGQFVLYGGYGPSNSSLTYTCSGPLIYLNDTYLYTAAPGGGFDWGYVGDVGDPSYRDSVGFSGDFTADYFIIFGGGDSTQAFNSTYRFYAFVHAQLTGPSNIDTSGALSFHPPFVVFGYGGSGKLNYSFATPQGLKNGNTITGSLGCLNITGGQPLPLSTDGLASISCVPNSSSYNYYRITVTVVDRANGSDHASANLSFIVSPPEVLAAYSQYVGYFYTGISFSDKIGVLAVVNGQPANNVTGYIDQQAVTFTKRSSEPGWWDGSVDTSKVAAGAWPLLVEGFFPQNWNLTTTYTINMIQTPDWLYSLIQYPDIHQTVTPSGVGPYNESYSVAEQFTWSLDQVLGFNIKIPLAGGNYSLIPAIAITLTATSTGNITVSGSLSLTPPTISIGPASLQLTIAFTLNGTFKIGTVGGQVTGITWVYAVATFTLSATLNASIPIYGFDILGVHVGFTLEIAISPQIVLGLVLIPTTPGFNEFISGIQVAIQKFVGAFTLKLSVAVMFSIAIASIAMGGTLSLAIGFATDKGPYITGGWVNGTIFVSASFLWWSCQWNLVSGTVYTWSNPPPARPFGDGSPLAGEGYNNGTGVPWVVHARYYTGSGYDANVWSSATSAGPAVSDIYPYTEVSAAAAYDGTYLFYTDDNPSLPAEQGIDVAALHLNSTSNSLAAVPLPSDPGFVITSPRATTLSDGSLYVVWGAVPGSETSLSGPSGLTTLEVQGARFDPASQTWGAVRTWSSTGLAESYLVDCTDGSPDLAILVGSAYLVDESTPEHLLLFNVTSGAQLLDASVTGLSTLESLRGADASLVVKDVAGNFSVLSLLTVNPGVAYSPPGGGQLISVSYAVGSPSTLVLLYRAQNHSLLVLYDLTTSQALAVLTLGPDVFDGQAVLSGTTYYVFARTAQGVSDWTESGGTFASLPGVAEPGVTSYSVVQFGGAVLVYSLVHQGGTTPPSVTLTLAEVGASLTPVPSPTAFSKASGSGSVPLTSLLLYLLIGAAGVAILLAVVAIRGRRRAPGLDAASGAGGADTASGTPAQPEVPPSASGAAPPGPGSG